MDEFESELRQNLQRRPAPPSLKRRILEARQQQRKRVRAISPVWMRLAASLALAATVGGVAQWQMHRVEERRRGEEAYRQLSTALRITNRALDRVQMKLAEHGRGTEE